MNHSATFQSKSRRVAEKCSLLMMFYLCVTHIIFSEHLHVDAREKGSESLLDVYMY